MQRIELKSGPLASAQHLHSRQPWPYRSCCAAAVAAIPSLRVLWREVGRRRDEDGTLSYVCVCRTTAWFGLAVSALCWLSPDPAGPSL